MGRVGVSEGSASGRCSEKERRGALMLGTKVWYKT